MSAIETNEKSSSFNGANGVTPKQQLSNYKPSKLFSKKSSLNITQTMIPQMAEQPRASCPKTALNKLKATV